MMRCLLIALCGLAVLVQAAPQSADFAEEWRLFKAIHGKTYDNPEVEAIRMNIYLENKNEIETHNENFRNNKVSYSLGINKFSDMLPSEMGAFKGLKMPEELNPTASFVPLDNNTSLPASVDWRKKGVVTFVKDQGTCRAGWAFAATGALESQWALKKGKLMSLSEQQLIDCDTHDLGCEGGAITKAFKFMNALGIESSYMYPYISGGTSLPMHCKFNPAYVVARDDGYVLLKKGSEDALKQAVATVGPVSVGIDSNHKEFLHYKSGVYDNAKCSSSHLDHGMLVVGYGTTTEGVDYYLVKNSWAADWGEQGYIKMSRNKGNQCGIATHASYPIV